MYWVTTRPCIKCDSIIYDTKSPEYWQTKSAILNELKTKPSNPWPDEGIGDFGLGMVKIYKSKRKHVFFKYEMRCFSCGFSIDGESYEELESRPTVRDVDRQQCRPDFSQTRLRAFEGRTGLYQLGRKVVPELERFS